METVTIKCDELEDVPMTSEEEAKWKERLKNKGINYDKMI
jgi:hypothetical protein